MHEGTAHDLIGTVPDETHRALVPYVDPSLRVHPKDGGVGGINEPGVLAFLGESAGDVLPDANDADDIPLFVATRRGIEQHLETRPRLGHEGELEIGRLLPLQRLIEDALYVGHELVGDELRDKILPHDFLGAVPNELDGALIPNVDRALRVHAEDGGVGGIDKSGVLALLGDAACDVLPDSHNADDLPIPVPTSRGVQ